LFLENIADEEDDTIAAHARRGEGKAWIVQGANVDDIVTVEPMMNHLAGRRSMSEAERHQSIAPARRGERLVMESAPEADQSVEIEGNPRR
jgi:hypothetical protein